MSPRRADQIAGFAAWTAGLLVLAVLLMIIVDILMQGLPGFEFRFLVEDPMDAGRAGGIRSVIKATVMVLLVCLITATPIGLLAGVLLADYTHQHSRLAPFLRLSLDTLAGVPSIVFGLFGNAVFAHYFGLRLSILAGGLTLAVMILPFLIRSVELSLRAVPDTLRRTGAALGLRRSTLLFKVLLPAAVPGLATGLVLSIGRAVAETAALLFTSGYVARLPQSVFDSGRTLSVHILDLALNVPGGTLNAYRTAAVLIALLLLINIAVMCLARLTPAHGSQA